MSSPTLNTNQENDRLMQAQASPKYGSVTNNNDNNNGEINTSVGVQISEEIETNHEEKVPIPWKQLSPLILLRTLDAITYSVIFPYIVAYITSLKTVPENKIGFYSGLAEGSIMLIEAFLAPFWAYMGDKFGKRNCLLYGSCLVSSGIGLMGFTKSNVWWILVWRSSYGLNPAAVLSRAIFTELSHPTNRSVIFSIWGPLFNIGTVIGFLLGGFLANPHGRLPWWLTGQLQIWKDWPFALPGVFCFFLNVIALILFRIMTEQEEPEAQTPTQEEIEDHVENTGMFLGNRSKLRRALAIPNFKDALLCFCAFQVATFAYDGFFSVFTYTPVTSGGLGLPVQMIGIISSISSVLNLILSPLLVPPIQARIGIKRFLLLTALIVPLVQFAATYGKGATYGSLAVQLPMKNFHLMAWPLNDQINASRFDEHPDLLATGSAIVLMAGAAGRAIGPTLAGWMFSFATQFPSNSFGRQLSWITLLLVSIPPIVTAIKLPKDIDDNERRKNIYRAISQDDTEEGERDAIREDSERV